MVFEAQDADTPAGNPVDVPMPVATVVTCVIAVKGVLTQSVGVVEAEDAVGYLLNIILTSSVDAIQGEFDIVQRRVQAVPAVPENVDVGLDGVVTVPPNPLTMLHAPVPKVGEFPARVTLVNPQVADPVWSGPAAAVLGF